MPSELITGENIPVGPIEMVVLQGTSFCNLNCSYCYLSEQSRRNKSTMTIATIEAAFEKLLSSPYLKDSLRVSWHSGEPLVLKPSYYRAAMDAILKLEETNCSSDIAISFDIQSNGTLISQDWCNLINEYDGLLTVGISCDGPAILHDVYRKNWSGKPTHHLTQAGMKLLCDNGIPFDVTAVISPDGLNYPEKFLEYFSQFTDHIREFHFNLHDEFFIASDKDGAIQEYADKYQSFLQALLDLTARDDASKFPRIRNFSSFYNRLFIAKSERPDYDARSMCKPFKTLSIETNGDVTTFYAGLTLDECGDLKNLYGDSRGFVIGNILTDELAEIANSVKLRRIASDFEKSHSACQNECEYYDLCSGGYNLIKYRRFERFDATQTPECLVHVKTFADTLLSDVNKTIDA